MLGFRGLEATSDLPIVRHVRDRHLGGVVLFDYDVPSGSPVRNVASPEQVRRLIAGLQAVSEIPLLVSVDQEGGIIRRLKEMFGFPATVSHQYLGLFDNAAVTHQHATAVAQTLAQAGFNLNLAPVVDLNVNPDNPIIGRLERSFSADPAVVIRCASEFIRAHHEHGVLCTLKHFPGHGSSTSDSHLGLVDVTETWSRAELEPYQALIKDGLADAIMTAHVFNARLDPEHPATLSKRTITELLRGELGYDGVVISDDMQMGAITNQYGFTTAVQKAIAAGVDVIAIANNSVYDEEIADTAVAAIQAMVADGTISEQRIDESWQRIRKLKARLALTASCAVGLKRLGCEEPS